MIGVVLGTAATLSFAAEPTSGLAPQVSKRDGVTVTVTPQDLSRQARSWTFAVVLETHTGTLDDDLVKSSSLLVDGRRHAALDWQGAAPGGHHRKGVLRFAAVAPPPQSLELEIRRAGEANPRVFRWPIQ